MAEARSKIIHQPKFSDLASGGMAQTNWKFVETLLKECKTKVNFLPICKDNLASELIAVKVSILCTGSTKFILKSFLGMVVKPHTRVMFSILDFFLILADMSRRMGKPTICICENKDADQLRGDREADQRLCFRYTDSTIPLLPSSEISSF